MSAKSTDEEDNDPNYEYDNLGCKIRDKRVKPTPIGRDIHQRAEEYIKGHPYVDSFLSSAQGYEVLVSFMVAFAKRENNLKSNN